MPGAYLSTGTWVAVIGDEWILATLRAGPLTRRPRGIIGNA